MANDAILEQQKVRDEILDAEYQEVYKEQHGKLSGMLEDSAKELFEGIKKINTMSTKENDIYNENFYEEYMTRLDDLKDLEQTYHEAYEELQEAMRWKMKVEKWVDRDKKELEEFKARYKLQIDELLKQEAERLNQHND